MKIEMEQWEIDYRAKLEKEIEKYFSDIKK